jgi:hypothetical protein
MTTHSRRTSLAAGGLLAAALAACSTPAPGRAPAASATANAAPENAPAGGSYGPADAQGWTALFDGTPASLAANWRGYRKQSPPGNWRVEEGALSYVPGAAAGRGDLLSKAQFGDFELEYEWRVAPGANSGVMWRVSEDQEFPWQSGPEQQVLDDERHLDGRIPTHRAGALYDFVTPPAGVVRPVGEYNRARVVARGARVQLYLNDRPTADVDFASDSGRRLLAASKFKAMPRFAQNASGHVVLQDHGDRVWFRNVRVRPLGAAATSGGR